MVRARQPAPSFFRTLIEMAPLCLIVEPIPLVAKDLAITARENLGCQPICASSADEALRLVDALGANARLALAFVHDTASAFALSPLRQRLEAQETKIILLGPDPGSAWPRSDWPALAWPFSTGQLLSLIASLDPLRAKPCA